MKFCKIVNLSPSNSWWLPRVAAQPCVWWSPFTSKPPMPATDVNMLTDRAHPEGHFHHARFFSHCLPDTVSTGFRLPGNQLQSGDCMETGRGELRTGRMECSVSFIWNWDAAFTVFFFFCSSPLQSFLFSFFPLTIQLSCSILSRDKEKIFASLSFPIPTLSIPPPPNLSYNARSLLYIWSISTLSHTPSICL